MTPDVIFQVTCLLAALGWILLLIVSPFWGGTDKFVVGVIIALLALTYTWLNFADFHMANIEHFSSLEGISLLYMNKMLLVAGWVHFLAFDLMVAVWIKGNSVKHGIKHWMIIVPLFFTCMLGPLGFLLYLLVRWIKTKKYFWGSY